MTSKDFDEKHIRGSGPGGQHRNKTSTGIRLTHRASGAVAEATEHKSQEQNRREAWKRIRQTPEWERWFRDMVLTTMGRPSIQQRVDAAMKPENIITQVLDGKSRWVTIDPKELS